MGEFGFEMPEPNLMVGVELSLRVWSQNVGAFQVTSPTTTTKIGLRPAFDVVGH